MTATAFKVDVDTSDTLRWDEELRQRLIGFRERNGWSDGQISRDIQRFYGKSRVREKTEGKTVKKAKNVGMGPTMVYTYRSIKWQSSQEALERFEQRLRGWLDHREVGGKVGEIDESPEAVKLIQRGLKEAHESQKFVVIVGQSGMGKTLLLREYANKNTHGGMVICEAYDGMTPRAFLAAVCRSLGEPDTGSIDHLINLAAGVLAETPKLLAIDEANFLKPQSINHLVRIYNQRNMGIVLVGTEELERGIRSSSLQRVRSRLKLFINLPHLSHENIRSVLEEAFDKDQVTARALELARHGSYGGYRDLDTLIESAANLMDKNPGKTLEQIMERVASRTAGVRKRGGQ